LEWYKYDGKSLFIKFLNARKVLLVIVNPIETEMKIGGQLF